MSELSIGEMIDRLARLLIKNRRIDFSFRLADSDDICIVHVHECEDYEFSEYGEEYAPGEMFEIGPAKLDAAIIHTQLRFAGLQEAGSAVLKVRSQIAGAHWDGRNRPEADLQQEFQ
ncbi:hypothetical protein LJR289_000510 [Pseudoduganella sp. LjRoot289]|uniref:hypothetical protein n=1 Tax=Pseudoduganella sp. LjRoot289 TaxID=3342314 RepID=UPI003ED00ACD